MKQGPRALTARRGLCQEPGRLRAVDTLGRRIQLCRDEVTPAMPHGQRALFTRSLAAADVSERVIANIGAALQRIKAAAGKLKDLDLPGLPVALHQPANRADQRAVRGCIDTCGHGSTVGFTMTCSGAATARLRPSSLAR